MIIERVLNALGNPPFTTAAQLLASVKNNCEWEFNSKAQTLSFLKDNGLKVLYNDNSSDGRWTVKDSGGNKMNIIIYYYEPTHTMEEALMALKKYILAHSRKRGRPKLYRN